MAGDPIVVALAVTGVLERLGIPYVIGGSVASTIHGEPRMTADVHLAIRLEEEQVMALVEALDPDFFVQEASVRRAAIRSGSFNAIHRASLLKADLYVRPEEGIYAAERKRAPRVKLCSDPDGYARVATAEDTILQKLRWYRKGGGVSSRQLRDAAGVVKACRSVLDTEYLDRWADQLGVRDLLDELIRAE